MSSRGPPARPQRRRKRVGRAEQAAARRAAPDAAPRGIDAASKLASPVPRFPGLAHPSRPAEKPPLFAGASRSQGTREGAGGYFLPFFAGFVFFAGAFFAAAFFAGAFFTFGFAARGPGAATAEGFPSEATSPK